MLNFLGRKKIIVLQGKNLLKSDICRVSGKLVLQGDAGIFVEEEGARRENPEVEDAVVFL